MESDELAFGTTVIWDAVRHFVRLTAGVCLALYLALLAADVAASRADTLIYAEAGFRALVATGIALGCTIATVWGPRPH